MIPILSIPDAGSRVTPATLPGLQLWLRGTSGSLSTTAAADAQTVPTDGQNIYSWIAPNDIFESTAGRYAEQSASGERPTVTIASSVYTVNNATTRSMTLSTPISLTGDFILWCILKTDRSNTQHICGSSTSGEAYFRILNTGVIQIDRDTGATLSSTGTVATSTRTLIRVRRASGTVYMATSGFAEENKGAYTGTMTVNKLFSTSGQTTAVVADIGEIIISTDATTAATPPATIDGAAGWFKTGTIQGSPAWNLSI